MSTKDAAGYDGDISVTEAWEALSRQPDATLVDVRTTAELTYVGVPDLGPLGKATVFVAWNEYPPGTELADFGERLQRTLDERAVGREAPLYFICRSGQRSRSAAIAARAAGYERCCNVLEGFEGTLDDEGHRSTEGSWKATGLPWRQS